MWLVSGRWSAWKVQRTLIECNAMELALVQLLLIMSPTPQLFQTNDGFSALDLLRKFGASPAPASSDGTPIVKSERWKSALNFNWTEVFALSHQLSTEGQTVAPRQMHRKSAADRRQKTDAVQGFSPVCIVPHTGYHIVPLRVQWTHSFKKAESLSAVVLSAVTWC